MLTPYLEWMATHLPKRRCRFLLVALPVGVNVARGALRLCLLRARAFLLPVSFVHAADKQTNVATGGIKAGVSEKDITLAGTEAAIKRTLQSFWRK